MSILFFKKTAFLSFLAGGLLWSAPTLISADKEAGENAYLISPKEWMEFNHIADPKSEGDRFTARIAGPDPYISTGALPVIHAEDVQEIRFRMSVPFGQLIQIYWSTKKHPGFSDSRLARIGITGDGQPHDYSLSTKDLRGWEGTISKIRLDPVADAQELGPFAVESMKLIFNDGVLPPAGTPVEAAIPSEKAAASIGKDLSAKPEVVEVTLKLSDPSPQDKPAPDALFTQNGMMLIDGKPVFVLGLGDLPVLKDPFAEVAAAGFTCVSFSGLSPALLDTLKAVGLKALFSPRILYVDGVSDQDREEWFHKTMSRIGDRIDTVAGYISADEPAWVETSVDTVRRGYDIISSFKPRRPVFLNHAPRNTVDELKPYNAGADIVGCDIYPVPEKNGHSDMPNQTLSVVGDYTDKMFASALPGQPVWMFLQAYGRGPKSQMPTYVESRFMAYNAILHGAQGIIYYGLRHLSWPNEMWPQLEKLGRELRSINDILVAPWTGELSKEALSQGMEIRHKRVAGEDYLIVANTTNANKKLIWSMSIHPDQLHVLFEDRVIKASGGKFEDEFAPYAVRVYASAKLQVPAPATPVTGAASQALLPVNNAQGQWIWKGDRQQTDHTTLYFRRPFAVPAEVPTADIVITADDSYRLYCNGELVGDDMRGSQGGWSMAERYDLKPFLRPNSRNLIAVEVVNDTSWAGLFAEVRIGEKVLLVTDGKWRVSEDVTDGWNSGLSFEDSSWNLAATFGVPPVEPWQSFLVPGPLKEKSRKAVN